MAKDDLSQSLASTLQDVRHGPFGASFVADRVCTETTRINLYKTCLKEFKEYARELRLPTEEKDIGSHLKWDVSASEVSTLQSLPKSRNHSGTFKWIGQENTTYPAWLWDSEAFKTVPLTEENLKEGYIAVSWTWGRYQSRKADGTPESRQTLGTSWKVPVLPITQQSKNTSWEVPALPKTRYRDRLTKLKHLLRSIPKIRYFWVDLLCIDQERPQEMKQEISKQAYIFGKAKGVISYLWTLDRTSLAYAVAGLGSLLSQTLEFGPKSEEVTRIQPLVDGRRCPAVTVESSESCTKALRDDKWFTSLWALQEIILSPAGLWMTGDGYFCRINGELVTTRLFALAIRLLSLAEERRKFQWHDAESHYIAAAGLSESQFEDLKAEFATEEHRRRMALHRDFEGPFLSGKNQGDLVIETEKVQGSAPWIIQRQNGEKYFERQVQYWTDWAFGTACIDVAITATRTAILLAGANRDVVDHQSRERALLAALKIQPLKMFTCSWQPGETRHFSTTLMNIILKEEGVGLFDVAHASIRPTIVVANSSYGDLSGSWIQADKHVEYTHIQDVREIFPTHGQPLKVAVWTLVTQREEGLEQEIEYHRNGHMHRVFVSRAPSLLLTGVSPCTATRFNPQISHLTRGEVEWMKQDDWHMHGGSTLHIPPSALFHPLTKKGNGCAFHLRPNGSSDEYEIQRTSDLKIIAKTQPWLAKRLGERPNFLILPLGICHGNMRPPHRENLIEKPEYIGFVLVGHQTLERGTAMTKWSKLGVYHGWGEVKPLDWKDGILVASASDQLFPDLLSCKEVRQAADGVWKALLERGMDVDTDLKDFEIIKHAMLEGVQVG